MNESPFFLTAKRRANLRLRWAGLLIITGALLLARTFVEFELPTVLLILVLFAAELLVVQLVPYRLEPHAMEPRAGHLLRLMGHLQVLAELGLITWAVYLTGGITSPLLPTYFVYLFADGLTATTRVLVAHALAATLLLLAVVSATSYGGLGHVNIGLIPESNFWHDPTYIGLTLLLFGALMAITLLVAVTYSRRAAEREAELERSARRLSERIGQVDRLREIGQRLAASLELDQLLDAVGESALNIVKATDVHIFIYDETTRTFSNGVGVWADGHRGTVIPLPRPDGLSARVAALRHPVIINDAEHDPLFQSLQARAWTLKAIAGFPIIKANRVIAVMNTAFLEPHQFNQAEQEALLLLADQAAVAIDNALLYQQVQRKIQELSALNRFTQSTAQLTDLGTLVNDALATILETVSADAAIVGMLHPTKGEIELVAHRGVAPALLQRYKAHPLKLGQGFAGEVLQTGEPLFVPALGEDPRRRAASNDAEFTSLYSVPLRTYDRNVGVLQLLWKVRHEITPTEINLSGAIAPQLALAMHNSMLYQETKRRADELATLRAIGLATTSTLNLREQLRLLYELVNQILRADTFFVGLYDSGRDELRIEYIVEEGWFLRPLSVPMAQAGLSAWVVHNQTSLSIGDLEQNGDLPATPQHITRPARSWLGVPLLLKERVIGLISAQSFQPMMFTPEGERFLQAVAQHISLALDNAQLYGEAERRARELTLLNEINRTISDSLDLDVVMSRAARSLSEQLGYRYVSIYTVEGNGLLCKAATGDDSTLGKLWPLAQGIIGRVARTGRPAFVPDTSSDPDYVSVHADVVGEICVPILREGRVLGLVNVEESQAGTLKEDDLAVLGVLSAQLAVAATNAALYREALGREWFATRLGQLGMTLSSTLDLGQLLDTVCSQALTLFAVDTSAIYMLDERSALAYQSAGGTGLGGGGGFGEFPLYLASARSTDSARLVCRAAAGWGREPLLASSLRTDELDQLVARTWRIAQGVILHHALASSQLPAELRNTLAPQSCLAVPLVKERDVMGVLFLSDRKEPERFGEPEMARAAIVASQAGLAISNARLYQEAQRRAQEQSSLYEIGLAVSSTLDLKEQLRIIYAQVTRHFELTGFDIALRGEGDTLEFLLFVDQGKLLEPFTSPLSSAGLAGWVVTQRRALVIDDIVRQWARLPVQPDERRMPSDSASYIGIPLMIQAEAIGVMALQRSPVQPFTADEQRFLSALAQQVAFAIENARLHQESQRNIVQQSLLYQASRRIAGALNLDGLLSGVVDALCQDMGYSAVTVLLVEPGRNRLRPAACSSDIAHQLKPEYRHPFGTGIIGKAAETGTTQRATDAAAQADFLAARESPPLIALAVPIKSGASVIGVLHLESQNADALALDNVRVLETISDHLAVAIENAQLYASAQDRLARINALQTIEVAILSTMNLNDRFDLILEHALTQMRADLGIIFMRDAHTRELFGLRQRGSRDLDAFLELRLKPGEGAAGWIMEHGEPLYIADVRADPRWMSSSASRNEGIVSYLGVPLKVQDRTIGVIDLGTREPRVFSDEEIDFFKTLASHAAVAIENARLYEQTRAQLEQLRSTQDRLVESERRAAIGELVAGLAHEVNNPLTAIVGHSQLMLETMPTSELTDAWRDELETISIAAQRIARIVQEFIRLSHVEGGYVEAVNLCDLVSGVLQRFELRDDAQDVALTCDLPPEPLYVRANPQLIEQVLENILTNALEALPHGGRIDVQAGAADAQTVFCSVRDSGCGIPAPDLKRVFEPGYTTKVESGIVRGIGLGLYTAERIVKSHGGTIQLESEEGKFTTVTLMLPRDTGGELGNAN